MRLLVTGGAGFIGSHFVKRMLAAGEDVVVLDKFTYAGNAANLPAEVDCQRGDIAVRDDVERVGAVDAIVNFAAETHVDRSIHGPEDFVRTDVLGTLVLLQVARDLSARFVQVSTDEVYGDIEPGWSSREDDPLRPSSPYSASKAGGDLQVLAGVRTFGVNASVTRGSNRYGPNQYPEKVLPLFTTNALDGKPLPLYGDGRQVRDWLHVDDHCSGIEHVLRVGDAGEVYNIAANEEHENLELVKLILEQLDADAALVRHVEDRAGHDRRYSLDPAKLRALGWSPRREWEDGIRSTIAWYREHRDWWETIKRSDGFRDFYERQYAARLGGPNRSAEPARGAGRARTCALRSPRPGRAGRARPCSCRDGTACTPGCTWRTPRRASRSRSACAPTAPAAGAPLHSPRPASSRSPRRSAVHRSTLTQTASASASASVSAEVLQRRAQLSPA